MKSIRTKKTITLIFFILSIFFLHAQNISSVDVSKLSDQEIEQYRHKMQAAGLSLEEAINLARQRGATEEQIQAMRKRLQEGTFAADSSASFFATDSSFVLKDLALSVRSDSLEPNVNIFGYNLFNNKNLTFEPSQNFQTPKNYEIGIGDQIIINIWGNSQNNYQLNVNQSGQIMIPDMGPVYVAGMYFTEAEKKIKQRLTAIYADMAGNNPQTFAQINIGELRSIKVNLVGEVNAPGTYTLPATATVFNALYLSGGPDTLGSFRNIKVIRNNKIFKSVDIYHFLVDADPSDNITLNDDDIIFVPPLEKRVEVSGEFKRNERFEIKDNETLDDLIRFAGGFTGEAYRGNIQIRRNSQEGIQIIDINIDEVTKTGLEDGDIIESLKIRDVFENRVIISGAVYQPGEYQWKDGLSLSALIKKADGLKKEAFLNRGLISRENSDKTRTSLAFDLREVISGNGEIILQKEDSVIIKSLFEMREEQYISISGEVLTPSDYPFSEGMTLSDAVFLANGFTEGADSTFIEVARRLSYQEASEMNDQLVHIYSFQLDRKLRLKPEDARFILQPFDQISVRQAPGFRNAGKVRVKGEVKYAGEYAISEKGLRISDLIKMTGGLTQYAFVEGTTFRRSNPVLGKENIAVDLSRIIQNPGDQNDLFLRDGDELFIPEYIQTVKVSGSVQNPFSLTYEKGLKFKNYIERSGGYEAKALRRKAYVKYANGETASTKGFIVKNYPKVLPGSEIIVPQKPEKETNNAGQWLSIASTFSSIAVAIAAVLK